MRVLWDRDRGMIIKITYMCLKHRSIESKTYGGYIQTWDAPYDYSQGL